ncbi:hypothetical protein D3C72_1454580 [compost metagenome]
MIAAASSPNTAFCVPSRYFRKYSWPLPLEPRMLERHTNMLRGKLAGSSGSSQDMRRSPDFICSTAWATGSLPALSASATTSSGLVRSCGADGSQPMRSARAFRSIMLSSPYLARSAVGPRISCTFSFSWRHWLVCA